jgi:hypothetical protein
MNIYENTKERIKAQAKPTAAWCSDERHLMQIIDKVKEWDIHPGCLPYISISNFRSLIRRARIAIRNEQKDRLEDILMKAATLSNSDFRLFLEIPDRDEVVVEPIDMGEDQEYFQIRVNKAQLDRIRRATKLQHKYVERRPMYWQ